MKGSSYIKLPPELQNSSKGLITLQNKDNEGFRWCHIRHLNPQEKYPQRIKKNFQNASECHISPPPKKTQREILKSETFVILPGISEDQHIKIVI